MKFVFFLTLFVSVLMNCQSHSKSENQSGESLISAEIVKHKNSGAPELEKQLSWQLYYNSSLKELKVIKAEKYIDTSSMYYPLLKDKCTRWSLTNDGIVSILMNSSAISLREWHTDYSNFPCYYKGILSLNGRKADFTINAGAFSRIILSDTVISLGYKEKNYAKYFLDGRASPSEYNE